MKRNENIASRRQENFAGGHDNIACGHDSMSLHIRKLLEQYLNIKSKKYSENNYAISDIWSLFHFTAKVCHLALCALVALGA